MVLGSRRPRRRRSGQVARLAQHPNCAAALGGLIEPLPGEDLKRAFNTNGADLKRAAEPFPRRGPAR
jgi:hypothetical protein